MRKNANQKWLSSKISLLTAAVVVLALCLVELLLIDRKYGIFTGGFGQSQALVWIWERLLFAAGYLSAMLLISAILWWFVYKLTRYHGSWPPVFLFATLGGGAFCLLLFLQYQLHSYFSDALSFSLLKNLGGGSFSDALLFATNEIALAFGFLLIAVTGIWIVYRLLQRFFPPVVRDDHAAVQKRYIIPIFLTTILLVWVVPLFSVNVSNGLERSLSWRTIVSAANLSTDFDRDGYGLVSRLRDRHPFDSRLHPLALDVPGNGIDEDGFGGDLVILPVASQKPNMPIEGPKKHLIVIILESARFDLLDARVDGKEVAPNLAAIAREGSVIAPTYSHTGFTTASLKALFTGSIAPPKDTPSLFRELKQSGYEIGIFSGQPEDFGGISETVGMRANADVFVDGTSLKELRAFNSAAQGSILVDEKYLLDAYAEANVGVKTWQNPQMLYFNFQSPHFPYHHDGMPAALVEKPLNRSEINESNAAAVQKTYWNAIAYADKRLGELADDLKERDVWKDSIVVITGDHGEDLFEDGFLGHGHKINRRQYGTFFVTNQPGITLESPIGLSDYRGIILSMLNGQIPKEKSEPVLMLVGGLDSPTQIGMAYGKDQLLTLRLDTGIACSGLDQRQCVQYPDAEGSMKRELDILVRLWGTTRWQASNS
ncbi:sulfatase-like hydrolase/transferase [Parasphingorhabdus sp.]|uniref:sulfatase-like hydrolase/transferase n=1 Tax=Parasphingorhabdus sp. TaxID=2709688 RepID=UPI003264ADC1